ncbi:MAG: TrkH family potassium uptake protein [Tissierellia bacterium]|nr:TrkH family potassium uptake protein [Tissierellia bacterium]
MNYSITAKIMGVILIVESLFLLPPLGLALLDQDGTVTGILMVMAIMLAVGFGATKISAKDLVVAPLDGLLIVSLAWVVASIFGALPMFLCTKMSYVDSFFEIVSGFTTTGSSVINDIESFPRSIILWRSTAHWLGGMGILVFTISLLPKLGVGGFQIFKAESPGPVAGKIESTVSQTAKRLYSIYMVITLSLFVFLLIGGMKPFDAIIQTLGVVGTGGFSSKNDSITGFTGYMIPVTMVIFMVICGTNFAVYYQIYHKKFKDIIQNEEVRFYLTLFFVAFLLITANLYFSGYNTLAMTARDASFQVSSIMSTSGFVNADYDLWPSFSRYVLLVLMFIGSCAGSTAGGIKIIRIVVLFKLIKREIQKVVHPKAVLPITINGKIVPDEVVMGINSYLGIYLTIFVLSIGFITLSGVDLVSALSSVATMLSNVGPGFGQVGPTNNFANFSPIYKLYFSFLMLLGRLEFFTILAIIAPKRRKKRFVRL